MTPLVEHLARFEQMVVPLDTSEAIREIIRRAFHGGAAVMFYSMMEAIVPEDQEACLANFAILEAQLVSDPEDPT